jgi:hypothetical protein
MRSPAFAFAFVFAVAFSGYAFADPQPLTRADCEKASMTWNDSANVCGSSQDATDAAAPAAPSSDDTSAAAPQPLTREDCEKASMKWNDATNVCGTSQDASDAAAAGAPVVAPEKTKRDLKKGEKKVTKIVKTKKGTKKTTVYKKAPKSHKHGATTKREQRRFFKWLKQQDKPKS